MFCPNCRTEYVAGILTCSDCGTALVQVLAPAKENPEEPQDKIVTVFQSRDQSLIPLIKSMLEEAGIEYTIQGELPLVHLAVGWVKIGVSENDESQAMELIDSIKSPPDFGLEEENDSSDDKG